MKMARSLKGGRGGIPKKITDYKVVTEGDPPRKVKKYHVLWKSPSGTEIDTWEPITVIKRLRTSPAKLTHWEEAYWEGKKMPAGILP
jgi:hypothetical protein